jgi:hypothetical protein
MSSSICMLDSAQLSFNSSEAAADWLSWRFRYRDQGGRRGTLVDPEYACHPGRRPQLKPELAQTVMTSFQTVTVLIALTALGGYLTTVFSICRPRSA